MQKFFRFFVEALFPSVKSTRLAAENQQRNAEMDEVWQMTHQMYDDVYGKE